MILPLGIVAMLFPALAAWLAARRCRDPIGQIGAKTFPIAYLPVALLVVPVVQHAVNIPVMFLSLGHLPWFPWLSPNSSGIYHPPPEFNLGEAITMAGLVRGLALKAAFGLLIVSIFALGEEIGWRGYMQQRLVRRYGVLKGIRLSAAVWALWHVPYAISGLHSITGVPLYALLVIMPVGHVGLGLFLGWLYQRTGSIWLAAIAHGAANNWGQFAFRFMEGDAANLPLAMANSIALFTLGLVVVRCRMTSANPEHRLVSSNDGRPGGQEIAPPHPGDPIR
jgi:membrane protease YdiL (CAAX protease family)